MIWLCNWLDAGSREQVLMVLLPFIDRFGGTAECSSLAELHQHFICPLPKRPPQSFDFREHHWTSLVMKSTTRYRSRSPFLMQDMGVLVGRFRHNVRPSHE